jgi:hypothetical protein
MDRVADRSVPVIPARFPARSVIFSLAVMTVMTSIWPAGAANKAETLPENRFFAGVNLLSPFPSFLPVPGNTLFSVLSNLECGLGVSGGMMVNRCHALELRMALGPNSRSETIFNTQMYYHFFLARHFGWSMEGLYGGAGIRYWDLYNDLTGIHRNTFAGEIDIGYRFGLRGPFYIDLRAGMITAVYSWLSEAHTTGGWATIADPSLPKSPLLSLDFGMKF